MAVPALSGRDGAGFRPKVRNFQMGIGVLGRAFLSQTHHSRGIPLKWGGSLFLKQLLPPSRDTGSPKLTPAIEPQILISKSEIC